MRKGVLLAILAVFIICLSYDAYASIGNESRFDLDVLSYGPGEMIKGFVKLSLTNESSTSIVKASANSDIYTMPLYNFLENVTHTCYPSNCEPYYESAGSALLSQILVANTTNYMGFYLKKSGITRIEYPGLKLDIKSLTHSSDQFSEVCEKIPVSVDLLDNKDVNWVYLEASDNYCGVKYSECYSASDASSVLDLGSSEYCQRINLGPMSKLKLGINARKKAPVGNGVIDLSIVDLDNQLEHFASCQINDSIVETSFSEKSCEVNYTIIETKGYYICTSSRSGEYQIKSESVGNKCGYGGMPISSKLASDMDFALFVQPAKIKAFDGGVFNETYLYTEGNDDMMEYVDNYLYENYGNDCGSGCVIPMSIFAEKRIEISGPELKIKYGPTGKEFTETVTGINTIKKNPVLISMPLTKIRFDALNITAPSKYAETYSLSLDVSEKAIPVNGTVYTKKFSVLAVPKIESLTPQVVFASYDVKFRVLASSAVGNKIKSYGWDFGDGETADTLTPNVTHLYSKIGVFNLTVKAKDDRNVTGERTFEIIIKTSRDAVNYSLIEKQAHLENFSSELSTLPTFQQTIIKSSFDIDGMSDDLIVLQKEFDKISKSANATDEDYFSIKERLDDIIIPVSVQDSAELKKTDYFFNLDIIDPDYIKEISGGKYDSNAKEQLIDSLAAWQPNIGIKIEGVTKTIVKEDFSTEDVFTLIKLELTPKSTLKNAYLIIFLPSGVDFDDVKFSKDYGQKDIEGAIGIKFDSLSSAQTIEFAMPGGNEMLLDMFVSPSLDKLEVIKLTACGNTVCEKDKGETYKNCPEDCSALGRAVMWIVIFIVSGALGVFLIWKFYVAIYDLMRQRKFFKTRKDYINLLIYVSAELNSGKSEGELRAKLAKAGWKKEQLDYVLTKTFRAYRKIKR